MFFDSSTHTLDGKSRVCIPKRFQQVLSRDPEGNMVVFLTLGLDGCLFLFSEEGFHRAIARMNTAAIPGPEQRRMQRLFFSVTQRLTLDSSGRLLIPEKLREMVGLGKDVVLVGVVNRAEIWPRERWEAFQDDNAGEFQKLDQVLCDPAFDGYDAAGGPPVGGSAAGGGNGDGGSGEQGGAA